jgi:uncharacterized protein
VRVDRHTAIERLTAHRDVLREYGIDSLWLFGSTARNESRPDSDVDLFFDYADPGFSLVELVRVRRQISEILGAPADVMTRDSLHPLLRARIEAAAVRVL